MVELKARLDQFARRTLGIADLHSDCVARAEASADGGEAVRAALREARDAGILKPGEYAMLEAAVSATLARHDGTGVAGDASRRRRRPATAAPDDPTLLGGPATAAPDDPTLLRGPAVPDSDDPTLLRGPAVAAPDDPTLLRGPAVAAPDEPTVLGIPASADPHGPTLLGGPAIADADDATVVRGPGSTGDGDATAGTPRQAPTAPGRHRRQAPDATVFHADPDASGFSQTRLDGAPPGATSGSVAADRAEATLLVPGGRNGESAERTRVLGPDERLNADAAARASATDLGDDTWDPAAQQATVQVVERSFSKGSVLKERFRLIDALGEGGMGTVWKAVDILKLEAEDRNPYVAIKLLQGDFKAHPESFIALQRESSKQQRLAHPNIATVFDFDREAASGTVFMTMEVMDGCDLADYIKSLPKGGLPYEEAMPLIEQLGAGLAYAHRNGLVHSDLKPGNCFLTKDRTVKLLDFGIARASATREDAEGEETKFDPGQLGALTPSYATIEMFQGLEPDPRDDIYAMSIIAYQLLTGKHPYNRRSAPKAMEEGLKPGYVDKLTKRQNRALQQGLAFERNGRTESVHALLTGLRPKTRNSAVVFGVPLLAAALLIGLWVPVTEHLAEQEREAVLDQLIPGDLDTINRVLTEVAGLANEQRERILTDPRTVEAVVALIARGDERSIRTGLALADQLPAPAPGAVKAHERAQDAVFALHEGRMRAAFAPEQGRHDFRAALAQVERLRTIYPELRRVVETRIALHERREAAIAQAGEQLRELLARGALLPDEQGADVGAVLATIRAMDPSAAVLSDPAIAAAHLARANEAIGNEDYPLAERILGAGLRHAPDDVELSRLSSEVLAELTRIRNVRRIAELEATLRPVWEAFASLADFEDVRADMLELADLDPDSKLLGEMRGRLGEYLSSAIATLVRDAQWREGQRLLVDYARLLDLTLLATAKRTLVAGAVAAGSAEALLAAPAAVAARRNRIEQLLSRPELTAAWENQLAVPYKELLALVAVDDAGLAALRARIANLLGTQAQQLAARDEYAMAIAAAARARAYYPDWPEYTAVRAAVEGAREAYAARQAEIARLTRLEVLKSTLMDSAAADEPEAATAALEELREGLPAADPFLTGAAPAAIARAYLRLAAARAAGTDFEEALRLVDAGLAMAPGLVGLQDARADYVRELLGRAVAAQLYLPALPQSPTATAPPWAGAGSMPGPEVEAVARRESFRDSAPAFASGVHPLAVVPLAAAGGDDLPVPAAALDGQVSLAPAQTLLRATAPALGAQMAQSVAAALLGRLDVTPTRIAALAGPVASYRALYPGAAPDFERALAVRVAESITALAGQVPVDPGAVAGSLQAFRGLFPAAAPAVEQTAASAWSASLAARAADSGLDVARLSAPIGAFASVFEDRAPDAVARMRAAVAVPFSLALAQAIGGEEATVDAALTAFRALFVDQVPAMESQVIGASVAAVADLARSAGPAQPELADRIRAHRRRFPDAQAELAERVVPPLLDGLIAHVRDPQRGLQALPAELAAFGALFPGAVEAVRVRLMPLAIEALAVRAAVPGSLGSASLAEAVTAFKVLFPGAEAALEARLAPTLAEAVKARAADLGADVTPLAPVLATVRGWLPAMMPQLEARLAESFTAQLVTLAAGAPGDLRVLRDPVQAFALQFPDHAATMLEQVAVQAIEGLVARAATLDFIGNALSEATAAFRGLFEAHTERMETAVSAAALDVLVSRARSLGTQGAADEPSVAGQAAAPAADEPGTAAEFGVAMDGLRRSFTAREAVMTDAVARAYLQGLTTAARDAAADPGPLMPRVQQFRQLFPSRVHLLQQGLAPRLLEGLVDLTRTAPEPVAAIAAPLAKFVQLFPGQSADADQRLAPLLIDSIERRQRTQPADLDQAARAVAQLAAVFPERRAQARARLAAPVMAALLAHAGSMADDPAAAAELVTRAAAVFPDHALALRADVAQVLWRQMEARAGDNAEGLGDVVPRLQAYRSAFPDNFAALGGTLAARIARTIQRDARDTRVALHDVATMLQRFRILFPDQYAAVASDVGSALVERLADVQLDSVPQVTALAPALRELRSVFPERVAALERRLSDRVVRTVRATQQRDPVAANALHAAARTVFPGNRALAAIRIELPLSEVTTGEALLAEGRLSAARSMLEKARTKAPQHSTIAAFAAALEAREGQAREAYTRYRKVVRTSRRTSDHDKALEKALALWSDNPKFIDIKPPAPYACISSKAGLGARVPCYDKIGKRARDVGPVLVVVPAGPDGAAFAIGKYEVSVGDFNRYCAATKACASLKARRTLPATGVSAAQAQAYAEWLSGVTGARYRLPTDAEWVHAATAAGKQPRRNFNCTVTVGNQQLKGLSLTSFKSGNANGWGLVNYIGNVQELVRIDARFGVRGGSFRDKLQVCDVALVRPHDGTADAVTGFRLVREVGN